MNKNNVAAKHIEDQLHNAAQNIANEVAIMLYAREQATLDKVLEAIHELEQENIGHDGSHEYESACKDFRAAVEALRGGERQ